MNRGLRWFGLGAGVILGLVVVLVGLLYLTGSRKLGRIYEVQVASLLIPTDAEAIERGGHLARIHGCTDCHGPDLSGAVLLDEAPFLMVASNLTRGQGGIGISYSGVDFDRAIRHGVRPDGRSLLVMPSAAYHNLSDRDAGEIIAYLQNAPPVDNELPVSRVKPLGRLLAAVELDPAFEVRTGPARSAAPPLSEGADYGEYLASITCAYCHGPDLRGGQPPIPGSPLAPDLAVAGEWPFADLETALRTGIRPDGSVMDPEFMPWSLTANMSDAELRALYAHLSQLGGSAVQ